MHKKNPQHFTGILKNYATTKDKICGMKFAIDFRQSTKSLYFECHKFRKIVFQTDKFQSMSCCQLVFLEATALRLHVSKQNFCLIFVWQFIANNTL